MLHKTLNHSPKFGLFLLLLLTASYSAHAQSTEKMVLNIPFAFSAGSKQLPAGEYSVKRISSTASAFTVQRTDASATAIVLALGSLGGGVDKGLAGVVLRRHAGEYFLAQIWMPGYGTGSRIPESRTEQKRRRYVAANGGRSDEVALLTRSH